MNPSEPLDLQCTVAGSDKLRAEPDGSMGAHLVQMRDGDNLHGTFITNADALKLALYLIALVGRNTVEVGLGGSDLKRKVAQIQMIMNS